MNRVQGEGEKKKKKFNELMEWIHGIPLGTEAHTHTQTDWMIHTFDVQTGHVDNIQPLSNNMKN